MAIGHVDKPGETNVVSWTFVPGGPIHHSLGLANGRIGSHSITHSYSIFPFAKVLRSKYKNDGIKRVEEFIHEQGTLFEVH